MPVETMLTEAAGKPPGTVLSLVDGRMQPRAAPSASMHGVVLAAAQLACLPVWRHRSGKRLRELDREERTRA